MTARDHTHPDFLIAAIAAGQGGVAGRAQLIDRGLTKWHIDDRVGSGHLHSYHRSVYVVGHSSITPEGRRWAAVLACGDEAALRGWSSAVHRGLLTGDGPRIDVVVPTGRLFEKPLINVRRAVLQAHEVDEVRGLRCTSVPRLLLELAADKKASVVERAWREAAYKGALDMEAIAEVLARRRGERGVVLLRSLYDRRAEIVGRLKGDTEDLLLPIIRDSILGEPRSNERIWVGHRYVEVDFYFPGRKLVIEGDSRLAHADPEAQAEDARRDAELEAIGLRVERVIWDDARWRPHHVLVSFNTLASRHAVSVGSTGI